MAPQHSSAGCHPHPSRQDGSCVSSEGEDGASATGKEQSRSLRSSAGGAGTSSVPPLREQGLVRGWEGAVRGSSSEDVPGAVRPNNEIGKERRGKLKRK